VYNGFNDHGIQKLRLLPQKKQLSTRRYCALLLKYK
jgi:hypothetical protein